MKDYKKRMEELNQFCKQTGYIFQGSEIYGGLSNTFDYGPLGSLLKQNIKKAWIQKFIKELRGNFLLDGPILLNPRVWHASGHVGGFSDPLIECKECNNRFRFDKLLEDEKNIKTSGWSIEKMNEYSSKEDLKCPNCGKKNWLPIRFFNMMFETNQGVVSDSLSKIYLRPENAQNVFIQFKNIQRSQRAKIPFGIGHIGKAFRNEITPGNFIFRTREFEQMELEYFVKPGSELEAFKFFKEYCNNFLKLLGIKGENLKFDDHKKEDLSHYSNATTDIQYNFPWGFDELWGIASRTDFDLSAHMKESKEDLTYLDPFDNKKYIPYVVEPSVGVERLVLAFLNEALQLETLENGDTREILKISPYLAPYKICILPLNKKEHTDKSIEVFNLLAKHYEITYDETQNIGKRYRRQDQIGTPYCITVDNETLTNNTVTVRERDSMKQDVVKIEDLRNYFMDKFII